jgi:hypothetical protein
MLRCYVLSVFLYGVESWTFLDEKDWGIWDVALQKNAKDIMDNI